MKSILFISHDASRSGAPMLLLQIIRYLKQTNEYNITILIKENGELVEQYKKLGETYILYNPSNIRTLMQRILFKLLYKNLLKPVRTKLIKLKLNVKRFDLIYANTAFVGDVIEILSPFNAKVVVHVHEMISTINSFPDKDILAIKKHTQLYIAVSQAVKNAIRKQLEANVNKIEVVHGFIDEKSVIPGFKAQLFQKYNIPSNSFLVIGSGNTSWGKGTDVFIQVANLVINKYKINSAHFIWLGKNGQGLSEFFYKITEDLIKMKISDKVTFTGLVQDPHNYYSIADIFLLTSREDSFPLSCIEAADQSKPIICFDLTAGGMAEFVENDCGYIIPYLDLEEMASKIVFLHYNPLTKIEFGKNAKTKVAQRCNYKKNAGVIKQTIDSLF